MEKWLIIGSEGLFGKSLVQILTASKKKVFGFDLKACSEMEGDFYQYLSQDGTKNLSPAALDVINKVNVVIFSLPIGLVGEGISNIVPQLRAGQLVCDVTSVKEFPLHQMEENAIPGVEIIGMHPLFAPSLDWLGENLLIVPQRVSEKTLNIFCRFWERTGVKITTCTASEHDEIMAVTQSLPHAMMFCFLETLQSLDWDIKEKRSFYTSFFRPLIALAQRLINFDPQLYVQIQQNNPQTTAVLSLYQKILSRWEKRLKEENENSMEKHIQGIKSNIYIPEDILEKTNLLCKIVDERKRKMRISILGPRGTYSELAGRKFLEKTGLNGELVLYPSIEKAMEVVGKETDLVIAPLENSLEGYVSSTLDFLVQDNKGLTIQGEVKLQIDHYLASADVPLKRVKVVYSHPQPIGQCRKFLSGLDVNLKITSSTAEAARMASQEKNSAAIVSSEAINIYGLKMIAEDIQDYQSNITRFIVYGRNREKTVPTGRDLTLVLVMFAEDRPGMLYDTLGEIAQRNINLTTLIARPTKKSLGAYHFFISMEGHIDESPVKEAVEAIAKKNKVKFLGSYPRAAI